MIDDLRRRAEERIRENTAEMPDLRRALSSAESQPVLHDLRVLCLLKSPFLLRQLMLRPTMDTLPGDHAGYETLVLKAWLESSPRLRKAYYQSARNRHIPEVRVAYVVLYGHA